MKSHPNAHYTQGEARARTKKELDMLASSQETNLSEMVKIYNVHWEVWPEYTLDHGNLRQIGVEVGLVGSHTSDPKHVDPTCPRCHDVRLALSEIADMIVERRAGNITTRPCWRTRAPDHSLILDARTGFRPLVSFSIVLQKQRLDEQFNQDDTAALFVLKDDLAELGIRHL